MAGDDTVQVLDLRVHRVPERLVFATIHRIAGGLGGTRPEEVLYNTTETLANLIK